MEEKEFVTRIKNGDDLAFEELVRKYQNYIFRLAFSMVKDEEDAKELTQEVFIKVYTSIRGFTGRASLSTWLYRITYNLCLDYLKKNKKKRLLTQSLDDKENVELLFIRADTHTPEEALEAAEIRADIKEGLKTLPQEQQILVEFKDILGLSYEEILEITGLKAGTLKSRLFRGRMTLKNYLSHKWNIQEQNASKTTNDKGKEEDNR
jgi:RNA polymerase sigma-70 factor (ECF subfamily)